MSVFNKNTRRVLSYDVLRQQKNGGYDPGVDLLSSPAYNVEPVTKFVQNRVFLPTPSAFDASVRGVPVGISPPRLVREKLEWYPLPDGEKISICLLVLT